MTVAPPASNPLGVAPHRGANGWPGQDKWIEAALDNFAVTILCGRDVGKTMIDPFLFLEEGSRIAGPYDYGYVAQGHPQAEKFFEFMLKAFAPWIVRHKNKGQDRWAEFKRFGLNSGARMHFWSGEEGALENVRGVRLNRLSVDEAGFVHKSVKQTTAPMLGSRGGKLLFKGTAKRGGCGFVWFKEMFEMGCRGVPGYVSFNAPSECSPFNDVGHLLNLRRMLRNPMRPDEKTPEEIEEYDGAFISDLGACFRNLDLAFSIPVLRVDPDGVVVAEDPQPDDQYVIGQDWGLKNDHTVSSVFSRKHQRQVAIRKEPLGVPYAEQVNHLAALRRRYNNALIVADNRDAGAEANVRFMVEHAAHMKRVAFTGQGPDGKGFHVAKVKNLFDNGAWHLIDYPDQREEFSLFTQTPIGEHGNGFYYEAPAGKHDDYVTAAIYAAVVLEIALPQPAPTRVVPAVGTAEWFTWKASERSRGRFRRGGW